MSIVHAVGVDVIDRDVVDRCPSGRDINARDRDRAVFADQHVADLKQTRVYPFAVCGLPDGMTISCNKDPTVGSTDFDENLVSGALNKSRNRAWPLPPQ